MYTIKEKQDCLLLQLDDADRRFKRGINRMQCIKDRIDELEVNRTLSLRKEFLLNEINKNPGIINQLTKEYNLINVDKRDILVYEEVLRGYKSMSNRKNVLEEERNFIVKEIEDLNN